MSLLFYQLQRHDVVVIADTLVVSPEAEASRWASKLELLPHVQMVIGFLGDAHLAAAWTAGVRDQMLFRDVDMLDAHTPKALRGVAKSIGFTHAGTRLGNGSSVYHFGRSAESGEYAGYVYRSANDFESERIEPGFFALNPAPPDLEDDTLPPSSVAELIEWAERAKAHHTIGWRTKYGSQAETPIGGQLIAVTLNERGMNAQILHHFPDAEDQWERMNARLHRLHQEHQTAEAAEQETHP